MTDIFVGPSAGFACPQREPRLGTVERLNARFLVYTQHQRILRRVEIQPNNVEQLGFKIRIGAEGERADSVGLQFGGNQHGMYRTGGQSDFGGERAHGPAALIFRPLTHSRLHFVPGVGIMFGRPPRAGRIAQALQTVDGKRAAPLSHRDRRNLQRGRDLLVVRPVGRRQDNAATLGQ